MLVKVTAQKGMVNIDSDELAYSDICGMYGDNNGCGLQISERLEHKRGELLDILAQIADKVYELQGAIESQQQDESGR